MALKQGASGPAVDAWNPELVQAGTQVDELRRTYLDGFATIFGRISEGLLGQPGNCRYLSGWADGLSYADALDESRERDRTNGLTHVGPHRAEVALDFDRRAARHRLSRGQQKLMGTALVLAQSEFVAEKIGRPVTLLVDEPAAELDAERLKCLMQAVVSPGVQLFVTALHQDALPLDAPRAVFHVEHGEVSPLL
jgi:DNA replication and repair protein RecF